MFGQDRLKDIPTLNISCGKLDTMSPEQRVHKTSLIAISYDRRNAIKFGFFPYFLI